MTLVLRWKGTLMAKKPIILEEPEIV